VSSFMVFEFLLYWMFLMCVLGWGKNEEVIVILCVRLMLGMWSVIVFSSVLEFVWVIIFRWVDSCGSMFLVCMWCSRCWVF